MTRPSITATLILALAAAGCGKPEPVFTLERPTAPGAVVIRNAAVLDVDSGQVARGQDVVIEGTRITAIAATGTAPVPADAAVIDATGATVLPGLIDMHAHLGNGSAPSWLRRRPDPEANLRAYLYCGVTTVFEPGDQTPDAFRRRDAVAAGTLLGPRIFAAGRFISAEGGHPVPIIKAVAPWWIGWYLIDHRVEQVAGADAARAAVRELAAQKPDAIKVIVDRIPADAPRLDAAIVAAAVDEARKYGLRAVAHIGTAQDALDTGAAGVALWVHGVYREPLSPEQVASLAALRIPMIPTIAVFENYALLGQGPRAATALERETAPADVLAAFDTVPQTPATATFGPYIDSLRPLRAAWRENVRALRAAGVTMLAGSDTQSGVFPGAGLHRELALLVESGMTPAEAIRAATADAARFLANGQEPEFGVLAPGKIADVLIVDGDPTVSLEALGRIRTVIQNGVPLTRATRASG